MISRLLLKKQGWDWAQPSANYEMAVVAWADVRKQDNEDERRKKAEECHAWLDKVAKSSHSQMASPWKRKIYKDCLRDTRSGRQPSDPRHLKAATNGTSGRIIPNRLGYEEWLSLRHQSASLVDLAGWRRSTLVC